MPVLGFRRLSPPPRPSRCRGALFLSCKGGMGMEMPLVAEVSMVFSATMAILAWTVLQSALLAAVLGLGALAARQSELFSTVLKFNSAVCRRAAAEAAAEPQPLLPPQPQRRALRPSFRRHDFPNHALFRHPPPLLLPLLLPPLHRRHPPLCALQLLRRPMLMPSLGGIVAPHPRPHLHPRQSHPPLRCSQRKREKVKEKVGRGVTKKRKPLTM